MDVIEVIAQLVPAIGKLIADLVEAGMSHDEAVAVVKRDIESRRLMIAEGRARHDADFAKKHGEALEP